MANTRKPIHVQVTIGISGEISANPLGALEGLRNVARTVDDVTRDTVKQAREQGCTWQQIGDALDVSRQTAWERFSSPED